MTKVFISYSRKDQSFAEKLNSSLQEIGLDSWIDWIDIPPTADWWDQIEKGIEAADAFLFLLSPDSITSKVCTDEINHAVKNGKRLVPLVAREVNSQDVHANLRKLNWIYFREQDDFEVSRKKLETGITTDLQWVESHRRLQVRAIEWERRKDRSLLLRGKDLREAEEQLASAGQKDPQPTDLQRQYVLESRSRESQTRNTLLTVGGVTLIILAFLTVFAFGQRDRADNNALTAVADQHNAETAQVDAVNQKEIAIVNEQEAQKQADIAFARQLIAQAQLPNDQQTSQLLAIQSMRVFPLGEAAQILRMNTVGRLIASMIYDGSLSSVAFSPDSKFVVSGGCENYDQNDVCSQGSAVVWEAATWDEIARMTYKGNLSSVAFSLDGEYVVSRGCERPDENTSCSKASAIVWETASGNEVARMTYEGSVSSVAFSPDSKFVVSGGCENYDQNDVCSQGSAVVWEAATGNEIARMTYEGSVTSVAFSLDGKYVVSAGGCANVKRTNKNHCAQASARVWEAATGNEIAHMPHEDSASFVAFSPDGKYIVSDGVYELQRATRVWEVASGDEIARMTYEGFRSAVAFSPDSKFVVSGSGDGTALVWEAATGNEIVHMPHKKSVSSVAFSPDGKYVVSGSNDGTVRVWEPVTGNEISRTTYDRFVSSVVFSPDGKYVVSGSGDGTARVWEVVSGNEITRMTHGGGLYGGMYSVAISPDGKYAVSGSGDGTALVWEAANGNEIARMTYDDRSVSPVGFSPDGKSVVSGGCDEFEAEVGCTQSSARVWETATGNEIARVTYEGSVYDGSVSSVAFSPDGKYVVSGGCDKAVENSFCIQSSARVWEVATGGEIARMTHEGYVSSVGFSPDGKLVVSGGCDKVVENSLCPKASARVWETARGNEIARITYEGVVSAVGFSPDGKFVVSAGCDAYDVTFRCTQSSARVSEAATGNEIARMTHNGYVYSVTFSPDGEHVVSSSGDGTARVWETATGNEIARMTYEGNVISVAFSPDGKFVVSGGCDKVVENSRCTQYSVRVWVWRPEDLISNACLHVTRNLTPAEWKQYIGKTLPYPTKQEDATCPNLPIELEVTSTPTASP
jgi:WD40 repeat protein